jgi:hypothetical protein
MRGYKVTFMNCKTEQKKRWTKVEIETIDELCLYPREWVAQIIDRAVERVYGKSCWWWPDSGLGLGYGQVMYALHPTKRNSSPGNSAVTGRVRLDIRDIKTGETIL